MTETCPVCQCPISADDKACPQCGFKLLGATQEFKPLTLDENGLPMSEQPREASLHVVRGPQAGVTYKLNEDTMTVGRSPQCSIFLNDMTVSRMHAKIVHTDGCYVISDENSYNGVWVNNTNVEQKALRPGDFIQIGTFCLVYQENEPS